jgi:hypothetical protein
MPRPQRPGVLREFRLVVAFQALRYVPVEFHVANLDGTSRASHRSLDWHIFNLLS